MAVLSEKMYQLVELLISMTQLQSENTGVLLLPCLFFFLIKECWFGLQKVISESRA